MTFSAAQWAKDHEKMDDTRFAFIFKVLAVAGTVVLGVAGWSLKEQYATLARAEAHATEQLNAIYAVSGQVAHVEAATVSKPTQ